MNAFQDKYFSFSPNTRGSLIAEIKAFINLKLGRSTVEDFFFNILKLGKKLRKSQLDLMTKFIDGLPHQLQEDQPTLMMPSRVRELLNLWGMVRATVPVSTIQTFLIVMQLLHLHVTCKIKSTTLLHR